MILPPSDAKDFFRLIKLLDSWFRSRFPIHAGGDLQEIRDLRTAGFAAPGLIRAYCSQNPVGLSPAELEDIAAWQDHAFAARFLVHQYRKDSHVFAHHPGKDRMALYQVTGLTQSLSELIPFFPCYVETRLLPFRGCIVSDGIISPVMVHFGSRMARSFQNEMKEHVARHGLITHLPAPPTPSGPDDFALLSHYLSTTANRRDYAEEIHLMRQKSAALNILYLQQAGKKHCKALKASLIANGILEGSFAVLENTVITGALTKAAAATVAAQLIPRQLHDAIVWIKL